MSSHVYALKDKLPSQQDPILPFSPQKPRHESVSVFSSLQRCDQRCGTSLHWFSLREETWTHHIYSTVLYTSSLTEELNLHLPLDVVLQQVLVHRVQIVAAHVVVVVGDRVAVFLAVRSVFSIVGLVVVVVIIVTFAGEKQTGFMFFKRFGTTKVNNLKKVL